ncbi:T9SS type A sorting domain-containing protein [Flammeovirga pectinis]|uniref:T9SS type A sorting domain-containing protein n=1 Tax=Flammeovirga pectinis TaxID=2494373 RepID=A0A3Q9FNR3_9BACT|nr:T9SS type A sorting domain-containing protein [Flammeovirga pectinis]AZQ61334.1 T9SS type A sorting domain-containing protein [Flammeovirga pectinis]
MKILLILSICLLASTFTNLFATTYYSGASGNFAETSWSTVSGETGSILDFAAYDESEDTFVILSGHTVTFPNTSIGISSLNVLGSFNQNGELGTLHVASEFNIAGNVNFNSGNSTLIISNLHCFSGAKVSFLNTSMDITHTGLIFVSGTIDTFVKTGVSGANTSGELLDYTTASNGTYTLTTDRSISNFFAGTGETFLINTGKNTLTIDGDLGTNTSINPGTVSGNVGSIELSTNSSGTLTISDPSSSIVNDLSMSSTSDITLGSRLQMEGTLTLTTGDIITNSNSMILLSNATILGMTNNSTPAASSSGGSDNSHILGTLSIIRESSITGCVLLPIGDGTTLRAIGAQNTGGYADNFTVTGVYNLGEHSDKDIDPDLTDIGVTTSEYFDVSVSGSASTSGKFTVLIPYHSGSGINTSTADNIKSIHLMHYNTSEGHWESYGTVDDGSATHTGSGGSGYISAVASSFSPFALGGDNSVHDLPVELTSFYGKLEDTELTLYWSTATEINNDRFEMEASKDGTHFTKIAEVKGAGNSNIALDYSFEISASNKDKYSHFRLRQIDFDGQFEYTYVLSFQNNATELFDFNLYPNPTSNTLSLDVLLDEFDELAQISIYNLIGVEVRRTASLERFQTLDVHSLQKGIYIVNIKTKAGKNKTHRFTVK